ncbi:MAG: 2-hydroxyacyl-CoA dehydratase [Clostridia bacterium]|nr:2-hydroxyacyl-CoA dehydratase [Clostridia bacterium]
MRDHTQTIKTVADFRDDYPAFTKEMKQDYTILIPNMLPWHFEILKLVLETEGYRVEVLDNESREVIDEGLKHVHNDTCYPALCVIGQYINALKSGKYDVNKTAVLITQSGGGCRASNYVPLIRKALKAEFPQVPVLSLNFTGLEKGSSVPVTPKLLLRLGYAIFYGDNVMSFYNQVKPYEVNEGEADKVREECVSYVKALFEKGGYLKLKKHSKVILEKFKRVERKQVKKPKVGIVGEIYVKYAPLGNNNLEKFLLSEGAEPVVPALMDFVLYCAVNVLNDAKFYGMKSAATPLFALVYHFLVSRQSMLIRMVKKDGTFEPLHAFEHLRKCADEVIHQGVKMGEGWLIPAEMAALAETGTGNIVCAQPFGCLPNHIVGKGSIRALKERYENENIVAVDYDPSATKVNQENRIKLMLATAKENLEQNKK